MSASILIYGGSVKDRNTKAEQIIKEITNEDIDLATTKLTDIKLVTPSNKSGYTVEDVKQAIDFLKKKPFSKNYKLLIFPKAEELSTKTQNMLLKSLEEPPEYATIILIAKTVKDLLETVISRCKKFPVKSGQQEESLTEADYNFLLEADLGTKLEWAEETAKLEKDEISDILENLIKQAREQLASKPVQTASNLQALIAKLEDIEKTNVNVRLALECLVIEISSH